MKVALFGSGKMAKHVAALTEIVPLEDADVVIDFSHADVVVANVTRAMMLGVPIVVGTTGWSGVKQQVVSIVSKAKGTLLYGANFAEGVYLFARLLRQASLLFEDFEIGAEERHHKGKADAPSGTALYFEEVMDRKVEFTSSRIGSVLGSHSIFFDANEETIVLSHQAKSKAVYAKGAIAAAEWLLGKVGIFTFDDYMNERLKCRFREPSLR